MNGKLKKILVILLLIPVTALAGSGNGDLMDPAVLLVDQLQEQPPETVLKPKAKKLKDDYLHAMNTYKVSDKPNTEKFNFAASVEAEEKLPGDLISSFNRTSKEINKMRLTPPKDVRAKEKQNQLNKIISRLRAVKMPEKKPQKKSPEKSETDPNLPNEKGVKKEKEENPEKKDPFEIYGYEPLSQDTLETIDNLNLKTFDTEAIFEMAEILYKTENYKRAAKFYKKTLNRIDEKQISLGSSKDWILFQLANSCKEFDKKTAEEYYQKILMQFPNSPWAGYAKNYYEILKIYNAEQPEKLLKHEIKQKGVSL